jgi:hypothetical protein
MFAKIVIVGLLVPMSRLAVVWCRSAMHVQLKDQSKIMDVMLHGDME